MKDSFSDSPSTSLSSAPKSTSSAMRQVAIAMLAIGTVAFFIGLFIASLTN